MESPLEPTFGNPFLCHNEKQLLSNFRFNFQYRCSCILIFFTFTSQPPLKLCKLFDQTTA